MINILSEVWYLPSTVQPLWRGGGNDAGDGIQLFNQIYRNREKTIFFFQIRKNENNIILFEGIYHVNSINCQVKVGFWLFLWDIDNLLEREMLTGEERDQAVHPWHPAN